MPSERVWANSPLGRLVCTVFGILCVLMPFGVTPDGGRSWHGRFIPIDLGVGLLGLAVTVAVWTSRLVLAHGVLTATILFIPRSMPLDEVVDVDASAFPFFGIKIRRSDKTGIRTFVTGRAWDELWMPRATRVAREIVELAAAVRA